ncbi:endonuclease/exonuclease/phosphatase family protein [Streptomyces mobaraensis]|uniref:endonuclease/exonuclease/phosphatase family protein n=1 Tax=Streptomyces mobaraensis TaxID=35621 RepID=UPI0033192E2E
MMLLTVVTQNLCQGGLDRWPQLAQRIAAANPDVVLLQEVRDWTRDGHQQAVRAETDLDMEVLLAPSRSGLGTGILYRRSTLGRRVYWNTDYAADETHHGLGTAAFTLPGLPQPLAFTSLHFTPYSADKAVAEADFAASRSYKPSPFTLLGGDVNFPPQAGPEPAYERMRPFNRGSRLVLTDPRQDAPPTPDRRVAWKLHANGFRDAAWELHQRTGEKELLQRTGNDDRIDQIWVSTPLVPALVSYRLLATPSAASDHHGVAVTIDTELIDTEVTWTYH